MEGRTIPSHLGIQSSFYARPTLDLRLTPLDLCHYAVNVLEFVASLPENCGIFHYLFWSLALHLFGNVFDVIPAVFLVGLDELVEVALGPVRESLSQQVLLLELFIFCKRFGFVDFSLFLLLLFTGFRTELDIFGNLVAEGLSVVVDLLVEEFKQTRRKELEVLNYWLFWRSWCLEIKENCLRLVLKLTKSNMIR